MGKAQLGAGGAGRGRAHEAGGVVGHGGREQARHHAHPPQHTHTGGAGRTGRGVAGGGRWRIEEGDEGVEGAEVLEMADDDHEACGGKEGGREESNEGTRERGNEGRREGGKEGKKEGRKERRRVARRRASRRAEGGSFTRCPRTHRTRDGSNKLGWASFG